MNIFGWKNTLEGVSINIFGWKITLEGVSMNIFGWKNTLEENLLAGPREPRWPGPKLRSAPPGLSCATRMESYESSFYIDFLKH